MLQCPAIPAFIIVYTILLSIVFTGLAPVTYAQAKKMPDTASANLFPKQVKSSLQIASDSFSNKIKLTNGNFKDEVSATISNIKRGGIFSFKKQKKDSSFIKSLIPAYSLNSLFSAKPFLTFNGGYVSYNMYSRSIIDTPIFEKNILQNTVNGSLNFSAANIPLRINYLLRRSNSNYFRDINDVQLEFDIQRFQQNIFNNAMESIKQKAKQLKDSVTGRLAALKYDEFIKLNTDFDSRFSLQKLVEAKELINVPQLTWDITLPDSLAKIKSDSLKNIASKFISLYEDAGERLSKIKSAADSLKNVYENSLLKVRQVQDLAKGKFNNYSQYKNLSNDTLLKNNGIDLMPSKYRWLLGIKKFSLGRSSVNYSELTAKNISLNGVNFEYNSWYYVSLTAGLVDYRFRDFNLQSIKRPKQYFYMGRIGIGNINKNYFIISLFSGQKRVYASGGINNLYPVKTSGISIEAKYQPGKYNFIKVELAESVAPDFRTNPVKNNKWNLKDKTDKAFAISARFVKPAWQTKIDVLYKYYGANFQSFSSFQTNSKQHVWNVKAEKNFFKKQLRITAAVKSNEYSNPWLIQTYQSNTVFKSLQAMFRKKNWPVISAGYIPMTQLTNIGGLIVENRFNSLNATTYHHYKISDSKATTTLVYTKFYNTSADSGFIYFNASNIFMNQVFYMRGFNTAINITHSTNKNYELNVLDENIQVPIKKLGSILFGVKINNLNRLYTKTGVYGNLQFLILKNSTINFQYEDGYIPGANGTLIKNRMGNIQLSKSF